MRRKAAVFLLLIGLISSGVAAREFSIRQSCGANEENLFSLYNKSGGNVAEPGYYKWQVCASGVEDSGFSTSCSGRKSSILSLNKKNDSHASIYESYRWQVCSTVPASLNSSCAESDKIVSLAKKDDSHVAEPGELQYTLCAEKREIDTVTLEMEIDADEVYIDGEAKSPGVYTSSDIEYPYIVSDQPAGIVSYSDLREINYSTSGSTDIFRVSQERGSFLLPNTRDGYEEIEDEQEEVESRDFLSLLQPSFAFIKPEEATVQVIYDPDVNLIGFERELRGEIDLLLRNRVDGNAQPDVIAEPN